MMTVMYCENAEDVSKKKEMYSKQIAEDIWEFYVIGPRDIRALRSFIAFSTLLIFHSALCQSYVSNPDIREQLEPSISLFFHFIMLFPQLLYYTTEDNGEFSRNVVEYVEKIAPFLRLSSETEIMEFAKNLNEADILFKVVEYREIAGIKSLSDLVCTAIPLKQYTSTHMQDETIHAIRNTFKSYVIALFLSLQLLEERNKLVYACTESGEIESGEEISSNSDWGEVANEPKDILAFTACISLIITLFEE